MLKILKHKLVLIGLFIVVGMVSIILAHEGGTYCCTSSLREKPEFA